MEESDLIWPERPTHHDGHRLAPSLSEHIAWRAPETDREPYGERFRTCGYCGSIHPADLLAELESGAKLDATVDWKYGWPHKFYVEGIPNLLAGKVVRTGGSYKDGVETPIMSPAPQHAHAKWYNAHLSDEGYSPEALSKLIDALAKRTGIHFEIEGDRLKYRCM